MSGDLTADRLRELLHYDPETGVWTWIKKASSRHSNRTRIGARAGGYGAKKYWVINVDGRGYYSGPLAVLYVTGNWPTWQVDHQDLDKTNDRWANLRPAIQSQNLGNRSVFKNNKSRLKGVCLDKRRPHLFYAKIQVNLRQIYLGTFSTPEAVHAAYTAATKKYFGEFWRAA